jgi:hypothetical protein
VTERPDLQSEDGQVAVHEVSSTQDADRHDVRLARRRGLDHLREGTSREHERLELQSAVR